MRKLVDKIAEKVSDQTLFFIFAAALCSFYVLADALGGYLHSEMIGRWTAAVIAVLLPFTLLVLITKGRLEFLKLARLLTRSGALLVLLLVVRLYLLRGYGPLNAFEAFLCVFISLLGHDIFAAIISAFHGLFMAAVELGKRISFNTIASAATNRGGRRNGS